MDLTAPQAQMLQFFAGQVTVMPRMVAPTCEALRRRGLIGYDRKKKIYRISDLGRSVVAQLGAREPT